jgi:hypothetical protein
MRLFASKKISTIEVAYYNHQFIYTRSDEKIINPWIDVVQALKHYFHEEPIQIGCFFNRKNKAQDLKNKLKPRDSIFFDIASDLLILKKSLEVIFFSSLKDPLVIRLCLSLTKIDWYQSIEHQHQQRKNDEDKGYLSSETSAKQVAEKLYKIFEIKYKDLYCEDIEKSLREQKKSKKKILSSHIHIYPISIY